MAKRILFIHGRDRKPSKENLEAIWLEAAAHGLQRDHGLAIRKQFEQTNKEFVYFGDLSNAVLGESAEDPESRWEALGRLQALDRAQFSAQGYQRMRGASWIKPALISWLASPLGRLGLAKPFIGIIAADLRAYWSAKSNHGTQLRNRLKHVLHEAWSGHDEILLVAHSLGSIIAYDTLWQCSWADTSPQHNKQAQRIDLLITLGSPLGDRTVQRQLMGANLKGLNRYPTCINRWENLAAKDDYICHDRLLCDDFDGMRELGLLPGGLHDHFIHNLNLRADRSNPHASVGYLIHPTFSQLLANWLRSKPGGL
jgi:hypothetical protein